MIEVYKFRDRFDQFDAFYLYGATPAAPGTLELLSALGKDVIGFVDKDPSKQKELYLGYKVISPDQFFNLPPAINCGVIIVAAYQMEIFSFLTGNGVSETQIFPFLDEMFYPTYASGYSENRTLNRVLAGVGDEREKQYFQSWLKFKETANLALLRPITDLKVQYDHAVWRSSIKRSGVCCDIGAFDGQSSIEFARTGLFEKVIAFEPFQENYEKLIYTIEEEKLQGLVEPQKTAIGAVRETIWQNVTSASSRSKISDKVSSTPNSGDKIEVYPLDALGVANVSMIKVDIEGYELAFLEGARKTIAGCMPHIAISAYHDRTHCIEIIEFFEENFEDFQVSVGHHPHAIYELEYYVHFNAKNR